MPNPPETRRKLTFLTVEERIQIIELHEAGWKVGEIANDCKVPQSTVSTVVKNKQKWLEKKAYRNLRKPRAVGDVRVEKSMELFVRQAQDNNQRLTCSMLREKAKEFAQEFGNVGFKASSGWLSKFVKRHQITLGKQPSTGGEAGDRLGTEMYTLPELIQGYAPRDVLAASETGLFFGCLPGETSRLQGELCHGGEHCEERITLLCATNMNGSEKLPLVVIGNREVACIEDTKTLPVTYVSNSKAWMSSAIFERWMLSLDSKFEKEHRQVVMFVDCSPVHPKSLQHKLKCINLQFLPANATSDLRPLDLVTKTLKYHYRFALVKQKLEEIEQGKELTEITFMDAINDVSRAWTTDLKPITITNCFQKAGFIIPNEEPLDNVESLEDVPTTVADAEMARLAAGVTFLDYCNVDDGLATSGLMTNSDIIECVAKPVEQVFVKVEQMEEAEQAAEFSADDVHSNLETMRNILEATQNVPAKIFGHFFAIEKFLKERYK